MLAVSVVIPAYNAADTLAATIASLRAQTDPNWEAIVVDDGSRDATGTIAQQLAQQDPRIRYIHQPNSGVCTTRNTGIQAAQFDWLLFLDADDWIAPDHLARMTDVLAADASLDAVHCGWSRVSADGTIVGAKYGPDQLDLFPELASYCTFHINACLIRKALVEAVGGFDRAIPYCEDWDLWQRIARMGAKFAAIREVLGFYRMRPNSLSSHVPAFCRDGLIVLQNACQADQRVPHPHPDYALGLSSAMLSTKQYYFATWCAGLLLGRGEDARSLLEMIAVPSQRILLDPEWIAENLFETVPIPTSQPPQQWYQLWQRQEDLIQQFLTALEQQTHIVGLADRSLYLLEQKILSHCGAQFPLVLGQSYGVTIEVSEPICPIELPPSISHCYAQITLKGEVLGLLKLPTEQHKVTVSTIQKVTISTIQQAIATQFTEPILNAFLQSIGQSSPAAFFQQIWQRPDWPLIRFYDIDCPDMGHDSPTIALTTDWIELDIQDELPYLQVSGAFGRVSLTMAGATIGTISFPHGTITPAQIRSAFSQSFATTLKQAFVKSLLPTAETNAAPLSVSVIIPAYNVAPYFRQTLTALVNQTYPHWEAIIIDDGSGDETAAIALKFAQQDSRIRLLRQSNQGGCHTRNRGVQVAYFDWVVFLDADDWWETRYLEKMTARLRDDRCLDAVRCAWDRMTSDGQTLLEEFTVTPTIDTFEYCVRTCGFQIDTCIVRRSLITAVGGLDPDQQAGQDWDLWQRIARTGAKFGVISERLSYYRTIASSVSSNGVRFWQNGRKVIARGRSLDPRVPCPDPRYAQGLDASDQAIMEFYFMLWCAGLEIAQYRDASVLLSEVVVPSGDFEVTAASLADSLRSTFYSTGLARDRWYSVWSNYESGLFTFLLALENTLQKPEIAQHTITQLKYTCLQQTSLAQIVDDTQVIHVDVFQPIPHIVSTAQKVYCLVQMNGIRLGELALSLHQGKLSAAVLADAIAGEFFWGILGYVYQHHVEQPDYNHYEMGWARFLQDLFDQPDWDSSWFYEMERHVEAPTLSLSQPQCQLEISQDLPTIDLSPAMNANNIDILLTIGGQPVGLIPVPVSHHQVSVGVLRSTLLQATGLELCRLYVRESILGQPLPIDTSLRKRLQQAAHQHQQPIDPIALPPIASCWRILGEDVA